MADERTRYSDAELEEFKQLILKKLENARADYELLRATITHTADNDTEDTSPTFKVLEEGAATLSKEESGRLASDEVHPQPRNGARAHREQDLRHLQDHRQAHPQGAPDEGPPRHRMYRGQGRPPVTRGGKRERRGPGKARRRIPVRFRGTPRPADAIEKGSPSGGPFFAS